MRFNITYTDYKDQNIITSFFKYNIKNEMDNKKEGMYKKNKTIDTDREFELSDKIIGYTDINDDKNYRIDLLLQLPYRKYGKIEKRLNQICSALYMNVLENSNNQIDKITFMIDDEKLHILDKMGYKLDDSIMYDVTNISINIYDNIGIIERIANHNRTWE